MAEKYNPKENQLNRMGTPWHTDLDLGRPIEAMTDMPKSRKLGFLVYQANEGAFYEFFEQLKEAKIIP